MSDESRSDDLRFLTAPASAEPAVAEVAASGALSGGGAAPAEAGDRPRMSGSEWFRVTLASIGDAVVMTDTEGCVVFLNAVAESLSGWPLTEARGRSLGDVLRFVDETTGQPVEDPVQRALHADGAVGLAGHTLIVARDDSRTPVDDSAAPIRDEAGRIHGVVLVFRSVAERRISERALLERERELHDFFENASIGLHWVGPDGVVLRVNRAELAMLGYTEDEYVGRHIADFHVDQDVIADILQRLAAGETLKDRPARMVCKDGGIKHVLIDSSVMWRDGQFVHTRCFTRDVTDTILGAEAQARLASIVESSQDAIVSKTLDSRIVSWNAAAEQLFGYHPEEAIGRPVTMLIPPELQDEEGVILDRIRSGERVEHYETVRVAKSGRRIDVSLTISPLRDSTGRIVGASKIARDVTARKRAEQRLGAQNRVTQALADSATLAEAVPLLLRALCETLEWQLGAFWAPNEQRTALRCADTWCAPSFPAPHFEAATREHSLERGAGLPGRVWASLGPIWIPDVARDEDFSRKPAAALDGVHAGVAFPIVLNGGVLGVLEFFSGEVRRPSEVVLQVMEAASSQVGQFIERKRAEAALRESEQGLRVMADAVPSILWTASPDGTVTYTNDKWLEFCGVTPERDQRGWPELVMHPEDEERCAAAWAAALREGTPYEAEARHLRYDGVYRWFVVRALPLRDPGGAIVQWFGTATDVDDRRRAEETTRFLSDASAALADLTEQESTLQRVAALAVPGFADWCAVDLQGADGLVRRLAVSSVGSAPELPGALDEGPAGLQSATRGVRRVIRTGEPEWVAAVQEAGPRQEHPRGVRDPARASYVCVPLRSRGRVLGAITFATAESGRTYGAADLRAAEDLAHRAVIAIENASLLASLKEADRRKDEFLAMLSHELRNPLAPIQNVVEILRANDLQTPDLQWATGVIDRQLHHMTRMVDDLLDVSRITQGKIELRKQTVELAQVLNSAVEASRPLIEKAGHELTVTLPPRPVLVEVDPTRLSQMLSNLLNNAAKYTERSGRIGLSAEVEGQKLVIRVTDNGIGIPAEMLKHVFDLFMQVGRPDGPSEGGLGIGLTLVRRLAEMHGGSVEAHSAGPGTGSEFLVRLPLPEQERRPAIQAESEAAPSAALRVLVVDDNLDAADSLAMVLRLAGHEVSTAHDGPAGIAAALDFHPDVVLMDIGLPTIDGYEAARRIREREREREGATPLMLIALTGWGQIEDRERSREAGFDHHLTKPVDFKALHKLLAGIAPASERRAPAP